MVVGALVGSFMYCVISKKDIICPVTFVSFIKSPVLPPVFMKGFSIVYIYAHKEHREI